MNENFKKINECLNHGSCMDSADREIIADCLSKIAKELNYANTVVEHLQKDLKKAEEDKEYNATLCNEKDKSIDLLKLWLSRSESREAQFQQLCNDYKAELKELRSTIIKPSENREQANCYNYNVCGCNKACDASNCEDFVYHTTI